MGISSAAIQVALTESLTALIFPGPQRQPLQPHFTEQAVQARGGYVVTDSRCTQQLQWRSGFKLPSEWPFCPGHQEVARPAGHCGQTWQSRRGLQTPDQSPAMSELDTWLECAPGGELESTNSPCSGGKTAWSLSPHRQGSRYLKEAMICAHVPTPHHASCSLAILSHLSRSAVCTTACSRENSPPEPLPAATHTCSASGSGAAGHTTHSDSASGQNAPQVFCHVNSELM